MDHSGIVVGLDIGTTKICVIVGQQNEHGKIDILGMGKCASHGVERGIVTNIDDTVESIKKAVLEASNSSKVDITHVNVGIAGQHIKSHQHSGSLVRRNELSEISHEDVKRISDDMEQLATAPGERILHVLPQEYAIDGTHGFKDPVGMSGTRLEANFHIITCKVTAAKNIQRCIEKAGLSPVNITLEPIASSASVLSKDDIEEGVALVDIGGGTTDIAIFKDGTILHTAVIPLGGNIITEDVKKGCSVMKKQAEALKTQFGSAYSEYVDVNEIISIPGIEGRKPKEISRRNLAHIIQARVEEIFEHVSYELDNANCKNELAGGIVLTGGGSLLDNIEKLVEYETGINTRLGLPAVHLGQGYAKAVNSPIYATGVGLVVNTINQNLISGENKRTEQEIIKKKSKIPFNFNLIDKVKTWLGEESNNIDDFK